MNERQTEIAVLRILGAGPYKIAALIVVEALLMSAAAMVTALGVLSLSLMVLKKWLAAEFGLFLSANVLSQEQFVIMLLVMTASLVTSLIPSFEAYKSSLHQRLSK